jgi:hypothetical protein
MENKEIEGSFLIKEQNSLIIPSVQLRLGKQIVGDQILLSISNAEEFSAPANFRIRNIKERKEETLT